MGYNPWGCKESDTTKRLTHTQFILILNIYTHKNTGEHNTYSMMIELQKNLILFLLGNHFENNFSAKCCKSSYPSPQYYSRI